MNSKTALESNAKIKTMPAHGNPITNQNKRRKHVILSQPKLKAAQELLGAKTESETIEIALGRIIEDAHRDEQAWTAHENFARRMIDQGIEIEDVFGRLER